MDATTKLPMRTGFSVKVRTVIARALRYCRTIKMSQHNVVKLLRRQANKPDQVQNPLKVFEKEISSPDLQEEWKVESNLDASLHPSGMDQQAEISNVDSKSELEHQPKHWDLNSESELQHQPEAWDVDLKSELQHQPEKPITYVHTQEHQPRDEDWKVDSKIQEMPTYHSSAMKFLTEPGVERFLSLYTLGDLLGTGGYGSVYEAVRKTDKLQVAVKYVPKDLAHCYITIPGESIKRPLEVALMQMTSTAPHCENVLQLLEYFDMPSSLLLVLERPVPCMDVIELYLQTEDMLEEPLVKIIMQQVVKAAQHCQSRNVFHRDIKAENLLFNTDTLNVKLIDFGCGDLWQDTPYERYAGTPTVCPPEWILREEYYANHATVWSLGVLLFCLVCGEEPFVTKDEIVSGTLYYKLGVSRSCRNLIEWCLQQDPTKRPSLEQISQHKWFREGL